MTPVNNSKWFALKDENEERIGVARHIHLVPDMRYTALCGVRPGYRYNGWELIKHGVVTCPGCRRKLAASKMQAEQKGKS